MKKTLIINIGNTIIHFEEDAFEALTAYLNGIKAHFSGMEGDFEIVSDIESRLAEMLQEILAAQQKQVINLNDAHDVMQRMGSINDFEQDERPLSDDRIGGSYYKRLYRDTEDTLVAGVCSGLAHYFNTEARWVRLIVLLLIFAGGTGILFYVVLWIVIPPAITRADKMAMRGEAANLQGFKRNFDEEMAAFKAQVSSANAQFQPYVKRTGSFITEFAAVLGRFIESAAKVFFKIIAIFIIVMGISFLLALLVSLAAIYGFWETNVFGYFPFSIINNGYQDALVFSVFITCFIPVLALVLFSIRVAFNNRAINKTLSFALLTIWLCGASATTYYAAKIASEFKENAELIQTSAIQDFPQYTLNLDQNMLFSKEDSLDYHLNYKDLDGRIILDDDNDHPFRWPRNVRIEIEKSDNGKVSLTKYFRAKGKTFRDALGNARNIEYKLLQTDSLLTFSQRLQLKTGNNWRDQEVRLVFKVPVGTVLRIHEDLYNYLEFYSWNCQDEQGSYMEWIMTEDGLKCKYEASNFDDN